MERTIEADTVTDDKLQWNIPHSSGNQYRLTYHRKRKVWDIELGLDDRYTPLLEGYVRVPVSLMRELKIGRLVA